MKITFGVGGAKYKKHDVFDSCGTLTLKATNEGDRYILAALARSFAQRTVKDKEKLTEFLKVNAEICHQDDLKHLELENPPTINSGSAS